jgi:hypothetical protein
VIIPWWSIKDVKITFGDEQNGKNAEQEIKEIQEVLDG